MKVAEAVAAGTQGRSILFVPDRNLGAYVNSVAGLRMELWKGCCHVFFYSTSGIIRHVRESERSQFVIATELGVMHRLSQEAPGKELIPLSETLVCEDMKKVTLLSLFETLLHQNPRKTVTLPSETAQKAASPVQKMLEL